MHEGARENVLSKPGALPRQWLIYPAMRRMVIAKATSALDYAGELRRMLLFRPQRHREGMPLNRRRSLLGLDHTACRASCQRYRINCVKRWRWQIIRQAHTSMKMATSILCHKSSIRDSGRTSGRAWTENGYFISSRPVQ